MMTTDYKQELAQVEEELTTIEVELQELLERQSVLLDKRAELKAILTQQETNSKQKESKSWEGEDFPWTEALDQTLRNVFKLSKLRPMQRQTMNATLAKEDCLLIMPTGGGKSLCFQLPALVVKGLTLVVSPLVSLMEDQQMALEQLGVASAILNAATSKNDLKNVQDDMVNPQGKLKLLYVTPEKLAKSKRFMNRLEKCYAIGHLARLVIDEVHCCSQWGHDFRPDYKFLGIMKRQFPNAPILGLTATATVKVLEDVKKILNIPRALLFKASFNRPNLYYEVREKPNAQKDVIEEIHSLISRRYRGQSGIVYCFSRKDSEEVTSELQSRGIKAGCYHADMDAKSRSLVHRKWLSGDIQVVVATVAFGMGIDKPDVRFVIHHSISKSMENLYQESGRAGRDDKRSDCIVFYRLADMARQSCMVFTEQTGLHNLHGIVQYCIDVGSCRRSLIARHFGEIWDSSQCEGMCDHCDPARNKGPAEKRDITKYCRDVLSLLDAASSTDQRVTSVKLLDAWYGRGAVSLKVKSVAVPGIGKDKAERILAHLLVNGYTQEDFHFTAYSTICYIVAGPKAKLVRSGAAKVYMDFPAKPGKSPGKSGEGSSSSSSSANTSASKTPPLSSKKSSSSSSEKPKLVVINKEKSHFSSLSSTLPTSSPSPSSSTTASSRKDNSVKPSDKTKNTSRSVNGKTNNNSDKNSSEKTSRSNNLSDDDNVDNDLNFDDSDEDNMKPIPSIRKTQTKDNSSASSNQILAKESPSISNSDVKQSKRKKFVISDESDDDNETENSKNKKMKKDITNHSVSYRNSKQDMEKRTSIIISDDDSDDFM